MKNSRTLMAAGGGAIAALALLGGVAMAQSPGPGTPTPSPAPTAPGTSPAPANPADPTTPGGRTGEECPDKTGGTGTTGLSRRGTGSGTAATSLY